MNKKEINEIRGQYTLENCGIRKIVGCYVDGEKQKVTRFDATFLNLPEEEQHKYYEIFKKTLSGVQGKNLLDMSFSVSAFEEQGARTFLYNLRDSDLMDEHLLDEFYDRVIETYDYVGNYLIILIEQAYDVPAVTTDNIEMEDASDEVYKYILCSICPVKLSKAGLGYDEDKNLIRELDRKYMVDLPDMGFLFPAFTDRSEDGDRIVFYTKNSEKLQQEFIANVLDCYIPMPAATQKEGFNELITETLGDSCDYETICNIHENINEIIEEQKELKISEPVVLNKHEMRNIFEKSGVKGEQLERFDESFNKHFEQRGRNDNSQLSSDIDSGDRFDNRYEEGKIIASNIAIPRKFEIKTPDVVVKINADRTDLVETRIIDGQQYLVIRVDEGLEVNGIAVTAE